MGGAKFMGQNIISPKSKVDRALEGWFYWVAGGWIMSFAVAVVILPKPNFLLPIVFYFLVNALLFCNYLYSDYKEGKEKPKKEEIKENEK